LNRTPTRSVGRRARPSIRGALALTLGMVTGVATTATPSSAASKPSTKTADDDRIEMPTRKLPPSVRAKRALGAVYVDVVTTTFDVQIGKRTIGRVGGVVDLASNGADLRYLAIDADGKLTSDPFLIRVRGDRIQVRLPADLRQEVGVDGYVTSKTEGSFAGVGVSDEVILAIALLTSLPIPRTVSSWSEKTTATTGPSLRGSATREDFSIFSPERFGSTADVEVRLRPSGTLRDLSISYTPLKAAKAEGAVAIKLVGTVARSAKTLTAKAPTGEFVTAAKLFDLAPVPESTPDSAAVAIEGDV
jgi:hypothetical protein